MLPTCQLIRDSVVAVHIETLLATHCDITVTSRMGDMRARVAHSGPILSYLFHPGCNNPQVVVLCASGRLERASIIYFRWLSVTIIVLVYNENEPRNVTHICQPLGAMTAVVVLRTEKGDSPVLR